MRVNGALIAVSLSAATGAEPLTFRTLDECRANQALTKAAVELAEIDLSAIYQPISAKYNEALERRNKLLSRLSSISSACSKLVIVMNAHNGKLAKEPLGEQASQMAELHELLAGNVLKAVPSATTRRIQKETLGVARSKMSELVGVLDGPLATYQNAFSDTPSARSGPGYVAKPGASAGSAILGPSAAAELTSDVQQWRAAEAVKQEQLRVAEVARREQEAQLAAERQRAYQQQQVAAAQAVAAQKRQGGGFFNDLLGVAVPVLAGVFMAKQGLGAGSIAQVATMGGGGSSGNSQQCQQLLAQIESDRRTIDSARRAQQGGVGVQAIEETIRLGQEAISSNQNLYSQSCG